MRIALRRARSDDDAQIQALVRSERLNPTGLVWSNFWVAEGEGEILAAAQIRPHPDGSRELGSVVVAPDQRGRELGRKLVSRVLADEAGPVFAITARRFAWYFAPLGFAPRPAVGAPGAIVRNYVLGQLASGIALLNRRRPRRLVVLERPAATPQRHLPSASATG